MGRSQISSMAKAISVLRSKFLISVLNFSFKFQ
nr:MAG TPA: hypothetical protein [Caudoviricetes sp.]